MPLITVKFEDTDLKRVYKWAHDDLYDTIDDHTTWAAGAIKIWGNSLAENFSSEGGRFGRRWQNLTEFTQQTRIERGFGGAHPILQQTGELRRVTADTLQRWGPGSKGFISSDRKNGKVNMSALWAGRTMQARITGAKVGNNSGTQFFESFPGEVQSRLGHIPARPFFFIPADIVPLMAERTIGAFMGHWQSKGRGVKREYGRMMVIPQGQKRKW